MYWAIISREGEYDVTNCMEQLTVSQLLRKFPAFYGTQKFITQRIEENLNNTALTKQDNSERCDTHQSRGCRSADHHETREQRNVVWCNKDMVLEAEEESAKKE